MKDKKKDAIQHLIKLELANMLTGLANSIEERPYPMTKENLAQTIRFYVIEYLRNPCTNQ